MSLSGNRATVSSVKLQPHILKHRWLDSHSGHFTHSKTLLEPGYILHTAQGGVKETWPHAISGFYRDVDAICVLLGYYAAYGGSSVPASLNKLSVPSSMAKKLNH